jgi:hypothetical protein
VFNIVEKAAREMTGDIRIVDNVFVKMIPLAKVGDKVQGHAHVFDHITLLSVGSVLMKHDNGEATHTAPCLIVTPKGITHEFTSLTDFSLLCCIHAIRDGDGVDDVAPQEITEAQATDLFYKNPVTVKDVQSFKDRGL